MSSASIFSSSITSVLGMPVYGKKKVPKFFLVDLVIDITVPFLEQLDTCPLGERTDQENLLTHQPNIQICVL